MKRKLIPSVPTTTLRLTADELWVLRHALRIAREDGSMLVDERDDALAGRLSDRLDRALTQTGNRNYRGR